MATRERLMDSGPPGAGNTATALNTLRLKGAMSMSSHSIATKQCSKCSMVKPLEEFGVESRRADGRRAFCLPCGRAMIRRYRASEKFRLTYSAAQWSRWKRATRLRRYGINEVEYDAMLARQGGRCAICRTDEPKGRYGVFCVDHDHSTGAVRGLLCSFCNRALAQFGDNAEGLRRALAYLQG